MSHFLLLFEPESERRSICLQRARNELSELGLEVKTCESGSFGTVWACARAWPGEHFKSSSATALMMGQALENGRHPVCAAALPDRWKGLPVSVPDPFEGIHMAALCAGDQVFVGGDILGRFPIYYQDGPGHLVVASSPELFRCHPRWSGDIDLRALPELLLLNYFREGRTLWRNVRRLGAGNLLVWKDGCAVERPQFRLALSDEHFAQSFERHADLVEAALKDAIDRHLATGGDHELFCSGGLDSRMLAGYLQGRSSLARAITWGEPGEFEMRCARAVVRKLGIKHETWPVRFDGYPLFARRSLKWQSLTIGFNALSFWQDRLTPAGAGGFISGQAMDCAIGGTVVINQELRTGSPAGFQQLLARENSWGIPMEVLKQLLRPEIFKEELETAVEGMRGEYQELGSRDFQRINAYTLLHRHRFHTTAVIGLHGLWGWPVLPALDSRVLRILGGIPKESFLQRRMQRHLVRTRFPHLARLPLDRNSTDTRPLLPRYGERGEKWLLNIRQRFSKLTGADKTERRFYYRIMDFNSPAWRRVREEAEPGRKLLEPFFKVEVLNRLVPPPSQPLLDSQIAKNTSAQNLDAIKNSSGAKLLTGLMLWARDRL